MIDNTCMVLSFVTQLSMSLVQTHKVCIKIVEVANCTDTEPRLNIKTVFPRYGDVKDKTVGETVLSLTWESLYWQHGIFILRRPPPPGRYGIRRCDLLKLCRYICEFFFITWTRWWKTVQQILWKRPNAVVKTPQYTSVLAVLYLSFIR